MSVMTVAPALPAALLQDDVWIRGERLEEMDRHHRANLIPFLRRNRVVLYAAMHDVTRDEFTDLEAEEWLEATPLMRRLCALEAGRPIDDRRATHERNKAYEADTGYQPITLRLSDELDDMDADERWYALHDGWVD